MGWGGRQLLQVLSGGQTRAEMHQPLRRLRASGQLQDFIGSAASPTTGRKHSDTEGMQGICSSPEPWTRTADLEPSTSL